RVPAETFPRSGVLTVKSRFLPVLTLAAGLVFPATPSEAQTPPQFEFVVKPLTVDLNEGCDIADFDGDGKLDVVAGRNWYRNSEWIPRPVRTINDNNGYVHSNGEFAYDV